MYFKVSFIWKYAYFQGVVLIMGQQPSLLFIGKPLCDAVMASVNEDKQKMKEKCKRIKIMQRKNNYVTAHIHERTIFGHKTQTIKNISWGALQLHN